MAKEQEGSFEGHLKGAGEHHAIRWCVEDAPYTLVTTPIDGEPAYAQATAVDAEGRVVVAGYVDPSTGYDYFVVARYLADGTLDNSFGTNGIYTTTIGVGNAQAHAVAIDADGRILVAGHAYMATGYYDFALLCLDEDGAPEDFGTADTNDDGIVTVPIGYGYDFAKAIAIDADGRVFLGGYASMGATGNDFALVCFDVEGGFDTTFSDDNDGIVTASFSSGHDQAYAIAIDSLGRIVMAGKTPGEDSDPADLALLRFTDDGKQDDQFGPCTVGDGMIVESYGSLYEEYKTVVIDADDRVIVGGYATDSSARFTLVCYDEDGDIDATFGDDGVVVTPGSHTQILRGMAMDSRGRIVAGGYVWTATGLEFLVGRYLADGQLDPSFGGGDGLVSTSFATGDDSAYAVAIGPGDQIYAAGFAIISTDRHFGVAHLNPDGTLTTSTTQYVYSPRYIDAVICRDVADGATLVEGSRLYYTSDANHNVTALLSADGDVVERTVYTPYGQALVYAGNWSETHETSTYDNTHLYTGRVHDGAIDLYYYRYRWYDAGVGTFVSRDPIGYNAGDENLYRYVGGMPTGHVDPRGTSKELAELLAMGFTPEEILALSGFTAAEISAYVGYNILGVQTRFYVVLHEQRGLSMRLYWLHRAAQRLDFT